MGSSDDQMWANLIGDLYDNWVQCLRQMKNERAAGEFPSFRIVRRRRRVPKSPVMNESTDIPSCSYSTLGYHIPNRAQPNLSPDMKMWPLEDRMVHLLALRPYKKEELRNRIVESAGIIMEGDETVFDPVLHSVAYLKGREYHLRDIMWCHVLEEWPFFTAQEKASVRRRNPLFRRDLDEITDDQELSDSTVQGSPQASTAPPPVPKLPSSTEQENSNLEGRNSPVRIETEILDESNDTDDDSTQTITAPPQVSQTDSTCTGWEQITFNLEKEKYNLSRLLSGILVVNVTGALISLPIFGLKQLEAVDTPLIGGMIYLLLAIVLFLIVLCLAPELKTCSCLNPPSYGRKSSPTPMSDGEVSD